MLYDDIYQNSRLEGNTSRVIEGRSLFMFAGSALKRQIAGGKTEQQQPEGNNQRGNRELHPGRGIGANPDNGGVWIVGGRGNQARKRIIPAGQNGGKNGDDGNSHQIPEIPYFLCRQ